MENKNKYIPRPKFKYNDVVTFRNRWGNKDVGQISSVETHYKYLTMEPYHVYSIFQRDKTRGQNVVEKDILGVLPLKDINYENIK